jgi:hypothetical protein
VPSGRAGVPVYVDRGRREEIAGPRL